MDSILTSIKKLLGIEEDYTHFDDDIVMFVNMALMSLMQLGVGPMTGYKITSKTEKWVDFIGTRNDIESIKTFIYAKVKILFDPPANSFVLEAYNKQIQEMEWRLMVQVDPLTPDPIVEGEV